MPVLSNPKHERFAQELAKGKTADEAYQLAGYKENRHNASRLKTNETVSARVAELLGRSAARAEITVERLKDMLLEDRELARELGQTAAAVSATDKLARLYGHMVDKKEVGKPGDFSRMSDDELDALIAGREGAAGSGNSREEATSVKAGVRKPSGLH